MGMEAILFNGADLFEQIVKAPASKGSKWKLLKLVKWFQSGYIQTKNI